MNMNLLKASLYGAVLWMLIFFEVSVLMFGFGLDEGMFYYSVHFVLSLFLVALISLLYFRKEKAGFANGLKIGLVFMLTEIILDSVISVPLFIKDYSVLFGSFSLWLNLSLGVITVGIIGAVKKK